MLFLNVFFTTVLSNSEALSSPEPQSRGWEVGHMPLLQSSPGNLALLQEKWVKQGRKGPSPMEKLGEIPQENQIQSRAGLLTTWIL